MLPAPQPEYIRNAGIAGGNIGRDHAGQCPGGAVKDGKTAANRSGMIVNSDRIDPGQRGTPLQCSNELRKPVSGGQDLDFAAQVFYCAGDPEFACLRIHERAEPNPLDDTTDDNPALLAWTFHKTLLNFAAI